MAEYVQGRELTDTTDPTETAELQLWPGQIPGVHDHKPYHDECPTNCPGRLAPGTPYTVRVRKPDFCDCECGHVHPYD